MTIFTTLHRDLQIPSDYHRTGVSRYRPKPAPEITEEDRNKALAMLQDAGIIEGSTPDDLLQAIAKRMEPLVTIPPKRGGGRPASGATRKGYQTAVSARRVANLAVVAAEPTAETWILAKRLGVSTKTIQNYRGVLRREGKIA
jgi:hypothetical protein